MAMTGKSMAKDMKKKKAAQKKMSSTKKMSATKKMSPAKKMTPTKKMSASALKAMGNKVSAMMKKAKLTPDQRRAMLAQIRNSK